MIVLQEPIWLLLLVPLAVILFLWPLPTRALRVCRAIVCVFIVLALCHPALRLPDRAGTVVVVADRSDSMPPGALGAQKETINLLQKSMGPRDQLAVVAFGFEAMIERPPQRGEFPGFSANVGADASSLHNALMSALGLLSPNSPGRILILSDGHWTGQDPALAAARAANRGIALDYRLMARPQAAEIWVHQFVAPLSVGPHEAFFLNAWVRSPINQDAQYQLFRGNQLIAAGAKTLGAGLTRLMFRDRAGDSGLLPYRLAITSQEPDPCAENNQARLLVSVKTSRPMLCVAESGYASGLARLLNASGLSIVSKTPTECDWTLEGLSQYSAVLLENITANHLGGIGLETLAAWIEQAGAGLMMTGGRKSYGPGGYFKSPLERVLPVSMEMRQEHRKSRIAIVVTLDRSGSMAIPVDQGRTKMDLANLGATQVLDLLMPADELGVIAVDSSAHTIVDLNTADKVSGQRSKILAIDSRGGGIFIFEALSAAARMLMNAHAENKHIILFADAADSEEPGRYQELLEQCRRAGITVSVVGLGTVADTDAPLLEDIARLGEGNCFFTSSPHEIPRLFAQDTFTVARSSFIEEATPWKTTAGITTLGGQASWQPPTIGGYNLCYLRPGATVAATTTDEYQAPVVSSWQAGSGRVLCFTGEADGQFSGALAQWPQAGEFYSSLARWTLGKPSTLPENMLLSHEIREGACRVELHLDPERAYDPFAQTPVIDVLHGVAGESPLRNTYAMRWISADTLETVVPIRGRETALPIVRIDKEQPITLDPVCAPYSPEFRPDLSNRGHSTLKQLARISGGEERTDLSRIWRSLPVKRRQVSVTPWFVLASLVLFLLEIFERRTGLASRLISRIPSPALLRRPVRFRPVLPSQSSVNTAETPVPPSPVPAATIPSAPSMDSPAAPTAPSPPAPEALAPNNLEAMRRARQRAQDRRR